MRFRCDGRPGSLSFWSHWSPSAELVVLEIGCHISPEPHGSEQIQVGRVTRWLVRWAGLSRWLPVGLGGVWEDGLWING